MRNESGKADRQCSNPERARLEEEKRESQYVDTREAELDISHQQKEQPRWKE